jgi:hypothetical protein
MVSEWPTMLDTAFKRKYGDAWPPLDPRYTAHLRREINSNQWPEVVYDDVLDADVLID